MGVCLVTRKKCAAALMNDYTGTMAATTFKSTRRCSLLLISALLVLTGCVTTPPAQPENICSIFTEKPKWHTTAKRAQEKWGTSMHTAMAIMYQESAFVDDARPPRRKLLGFIPWKRPSSAYGYSQAVNGTWLQYKRSTGESWRQRDNFTDATDFIHWYLNQSRRRNGLSPDDVYSLYLTYHEGWVGYKAKSYQSKAWLKNAAQNVARRSKQYAIQYGGCKDKFKRESWWRRLI